LFLDVCLCVYAVLTSKLLHDWILHFDRLDSLAEIRERAAPIHYVSNDYIACFTCNSLPFCWRNDFDDTRFHPMFINLVDEAFEVTKLVHSLGAQVSI
jgi:hypothetical protein